MWFKVVVVGLKAAAGQTKPKAAEVFCGFSVNESGCHVQDQALAPFCWPLGPENQTPKEFMAPEEFTFTLTQGDGSRLQGFCRRFLPPAPRVGSRLRYPQVLCLVCEVSWSAFFFKVLEVAEQLLRQTDLLSDFSHKQLPQDSLAGVFLNNLGAVLAQQPELGSVIRVELPSISIPLAMSPPKRIGSAATEEPLPLLLTVEFIELQVPPDAGNGAANAGVSLARLLWHVPVPAMVTLIASLLLERRVLVVGQSRDMVSAAVLAAQALIHPFRWHHIFLPLLPRSLSDYLTAPMPFLIGMPAQLLPAIKNLPMDEITLIDLDLGKCEPAPGSARDDAQLLPWRDQLESALHAAFSLLKSPTEQESNPVIAGIIHGYFLKLLGNYRSHIYPEGTGPGFFPQQQQQQPGSLPPSSPSQQLPPSGARTSQGHQRSRSASPLPGGGASSNALAAFAAAASGGGDPRQSPRSTTSRGGVGSASASASGSRRQSRASSSNVGPAAADEGMKAHGFWFDHAGLVAAHRRNERARTFLTLLRQSQLFEVFVRERLEMCATLPGGPELSGDPFEQLVNAYLENRSKRLTARLGAGVRSSLSRFGALIKKHRRAESTQIVGSAGFSSSGGDGRPSSSGSASGGFASGLMSGLSRGRGGGLAGGFAERPEALKMRQMVASFAATAEQMRRNLADGSSKPGPRPSLTPLEAFADRVVSVFDPSTLFDDDDEDIEAEAVAAEAAAAAAAAAAATGGGGGRLSRSSMSSNSLRDMVSGPLVAPSGASWTAGASSSTRSGSLATQSVHAAYAGASSGASSSGSSGMGSGALPRGLTAGSGGRGSPPLGRHSVPVVMHAASGMSSGSPRGERPPSPGPLIDLGGGEAGSNSPGAAAAAAAAQGMTSSSAGALPVPQQQQQQQPPPHHRYLEQLQMPGHQQQQQQQHHQVHSPNSPRDLQSQWHAQQQQQQQRSPRGTRESLIQQFMRPPLSSSGGSSSSSSGMRGQQLHQQQQHIYVKAALAAIAPGPLPQPPPPRARSLVGGGGGGHILEPPQHPSVHMQPLRQGLANLSHLQAHQQQQQQLGVSQQSMQVAGAAAGAQAAGVAGLSTIWASSSQAMAAGSSSDAWDPFAELLTERTASLSGGVAPIAQLQQQQQVGLLSGPARGQSAGSDGGASAADSFGGVRLAGHLAGNSSSSSGDGSAGSSSDGGAASQGFSNSTTPAAPLGDLHSSFALEAGGGAQQQQQQQSSSSVLQQQPTMPEAWLSALNDLGLAEGAGGSGSGHGSSISLNGSGRAGRQGAGGLSATMGPGCDNGRSEDGGLSQLKQAFAAQMTVQHGSAGDDLL